MIYMNPITAAALPAALAQQRLAAEETREHSERQVIGRGTAAERDRFEHVVDATEAIPAVNDEQRRDDPPPKRKRPKRRADGAGPDDGRSELPQLDVTG